MAYCYMLLCSDRTIYVGSTVDLDKRFWEHNEGFGAEYTKRRLPVELFWCQEFDRIEDAYAWEKRMQGWSHEKRLAFARGGFDAIKGWNAQQRRRAAQRGMRPTKN